MLMHAENSSLQDSSAQRRTDLVLPGTEVPSTASQTTALPHQCRKYPAKTCQDCHHTLPRPPNLPATHLPTSLTRAHSPATHTTRSSRDIRMPTNKMTLSPKRIFGDPGREKIPSFRRTLNFP